MAAWCLSCAAAIPSTAPSTSTSPLSSVSVGAHPGGVASFNSSFLPPFFRGLRRRVAVSFAHRSGPAICMAPEEEKMTRRSPLDFPIEWERPKPGRRPDIFPQFSPMRTPLPTPMPADPPEEDEEEEEKKEEEEEDPEKEEPEKPENE
ncbi:hypothetical protein EJ110_NYTH01237 [Nymphaea thermarum]|nr:hypothetical protein EJ110_NYTH01237 [Nymphaea thermarum]